MKLSWGTGIVIVFAVFIAAMILIIVFAFNRESELVTNDYYDKELAYQDQIEKINRTNLLREKPEFIQNGDGIGIKFPSAYGKITGKVFFYRPSDSKSDFSYEIMPDTLGLQSLDVSRFRPGYWKVRLMWIMKGEEYFLEKAVVI